MASFVLSQISIPPIQGFLYNQAGRRIGEITSNCRLHNLRASALEMSELDISFLVSSKSGLGVQENLSSLFPHTRWVVVVFYCKIFLGRLVYFVSSHSICELFLFKIKSRHDGRLLKLVAGAGI